MKRLKLSSYQAAVEMLSLALFSYMCWSVISQRPMSLLPIFALCVLISADIIWRTIRISKYKKP